jgi:integrase
MPKNGKTRKVDISNQLALALKEQQAKEKRESFLDGLGDLQGLVFHRKGGDIMEQNFIRRVYERALSKAGIRKIKFHALRHTFASLLLSKGESPVYVKEQLGHSSIQITVDIYGKWMPTSRMVGVNRLDTPHLSAPQTHPEKTKKAQHIDVTPHIKAMVPKAGFDGKK